MKIHIRELPKSVGSPVHGQVFKDPHTGIQYIIQICCEGENCPGGHVFRWEDHDYLDRPNTFEELLDSPEEAMKYMDIGLTIGLWALFANVEPEHMFFKILANHSTLTRLENLMNGIGDYIQKLDDDEHDVPPWWDDDGEFSSHNAEWN